MTNSPMTIKEAQDKVDEWMKTHGVRYFNELTNMAILTEEVGEVARIISRTYGEQSFKNKEEEKKLGDELADVMFVLICLANQTGVDLTKAFEKNLEKKTKRDDKRHKENDKLSQKGESQKSKNKKVRREKSKKSEGENSHKGESQKSKKNK